MKMSCVLCDPSGRNEEFESFKQLREHLQKSHNGSTLCNVCYHANRYFPRELEIFKGAEFQRHMESHPKCEYCGHRYFGKDELFNHMKKKHCLCHLCHARGERHVYFENTQHYRQHLQESHFVCSEPDCVDCLIAFNSVQELNSHLADVHGIRAVARGGGGRAAQRANTIVTHFNAATSRPVSQRRVFEGNELQQRGSEGMMMIDDDLPPVYAVPPSNPVHHRPVRSAPRREEFPALPVVNPATARPAPPVKTLVRTECPCGRRSQSVLVREGTTPDALVCDAECERAKHRARLAAAFNIDTNTYSGAFSSTFSVDLITWARLYPQKAHQIEEQLYERIRRRDIQRFTLEGITRDMKKLVIELVDSCGAVGRSVRNANSVEVILTDRCSLPAKKLCQYATSLSEEEYRNLVRESLKNVMFLEEIEKSVNPRRYLMTWDGDYEMEWVSNSVTKLKFRTPQAFKSASNGLAGGIRGAFKVRYPLKEPDNDPQSEVTKSKGTEEDGVNRSAERQRDRRNPWKKERPPAEELILGNSFEALSRL